MTKGTPEQSHRILTELRDGPLALTTLGHRTGTTFLSLANILNILAAARLVEIEGEPGFERATLSPAGAKLVAQH